MKVVEAKDVVFAIGADAPPPDMEVEEPGEFVYKNLVYFPTIEFQYGDDAPSGPCTVDGRGDSRAFVIRVGQEGGEGYAGPMSVEAEPLLEGADVYFAVGGKCVEKVEFDRWPGRVAGTVSLGEPPLKSDLEEHGDLLTRFVLKVPGSGPIVIVPGKGSKSDRLDTLTPEEPSDTEPPQAHIDHWHTAYSVVVCGRTLEPTHEQRDPKGIHSHDDGVIHVHPVVAAAAGRNANIGVFFDAVGETLSDDWVSWGGEKWREGEDECSGKPAEVVVQTAQGRTTESVSSVRLRNCSWVTVGFVAKGTQLEAPVGYEKRFENLADLGGSGC